MTIDLKNKKIIISAGGSGIGWSTTKIFLEKGATVYICDINPIFLKKCRKHKLINKKLFVFECDASDEDQVKNFFIKVSKKTKKLDGLINNVGIFRGKNFFEETSQDWDDHFKVNLMSGVKLSKYLLPKMIKKNWGRIIFISSECSTLVPGDLLSYSVSKASVSVFSSGLAKLTKGSNVTVNTIVPGSTLSEGSEEFLTETAKREKKTKEEVEKSFFKDVRNSSLISRFLTVSEVANTILYLSSPLSSGTNGASIRVDGGSMGSII